MRLGMSKCDVKLHSESAEGHIVSCANELPAYGRQGLFDTRGV